MNFFERPMLAVLFPGVAWSFVAAMQIYMWKHGYGASKRPLSDEILIAQVLLLEGVVLCVAALYPVIRAWHGKRINNVLIGSAIASMAFLFWWGPSALQVLMRKSGVSA
jgi:hypothetical protein